MKKSRTWKELVEKERKNEMKKEQMEGKEEKNQSPKGNMWSAIPVALLCVNVNVGDG